MPRRAHFRRTGLGAVALVLALTAPAAFCQTDPGWRFWTVTEGLPESFIRSVATGPDGRIWLRHGAVDAMSVLDGYGIVRLPELHTGPISDFGQSARVYAGPGGEAWSVERGELKVFRSGSWKVEIPNRAEDRIRAAVPHGVGRVLVLFADRVAAYYPKDRTWKVIKHREETVLGDFLQIAPGGANEFWITGAAGVARLAFAGDDAAEMWTECSTRRLGMTDIQYPLPSGGQEVFVSGRLGAARWAVARWKAPALEIVYTGQQDNIRGWRGSDGGFWVLDGTSLFQIAGGKRQPVPRRDVLSGTVYDVLTAGDGSFWVGTSNGLAKYTPPLWRTPPAVADLDAPVHAIAEDRAGRIWFSATQYLLELDGATWRRHAMPSGIRTHSTLSNSLWPWPDGRIAVKARADNGKESVLLFDPRTRRFEPFLHPSGKAVGLIVPRRDGTVWVRTKPGFQVEIYDGKVFRPQFELPASWGGDEVRCLMESADGAVWIGGTSAAVVWQNGVVRKLGPADGFQESAGFAIFESRPGRVLIGGRDLLMESDGRRWQVLKSGLDRVRLITRTRDGTLWVASGSGLHRVLDGQWITNGESEGLASNAAHTLFEDSRGRIWAGCAAGLSLFHPETDRDPPRVSFAPTGNLREAGPDGNLRVVFSGADRWEMTPPDRLLYSYALDSGAWSPFAPEDSASVRGLASGVHRMQVRGMDRNGNRQVAPECFEFTVALPWFRQGGFLAMASAGVVIIMVLVGVAATIHRQRSRLILELSESRLAAESASRHKSQFLANMSHEIRTPMNAIMGMTELALESASDREQREYLSTVQKAADSLLSLLNDILDFSKVEAGKLQLAAVDFDGEETLREALRTLAIRAREKGLNLALRVAPEVPRYLLGDDRRLRQIVLNLVGNAIKFTSAGEVRVEVKLQTENSDSVVLECSVLDTGIGIQPEKQQAVFAPFEQEDGSTTRKYGGTGLGLAICAKLVELMQGRIWVESPWQDSGTGRQITGSAFHFTLPFLRGKAPVREQPEGTWVAPTGLRVLLAEDNLVNQTVATHLLHRHRHTVFVANNGLEALEILRREFVDLVLMDIQMPELDGFQAVAAIREREGRDGGHVQIVALTAMAMSGDGARCLAKGFDAYLAKPIRADDLDRVLAAMINHA